MMKFLGTQANNTGRFSKESGYFSDLSMASFLLSFPPFPAVKSAIPHQRSRTCVPGKCGMENGNVTTSPPQGTEKTLQCRNNPKNQPKGIINVKPSQEEAEPGGKQVGCRPSQAAGYHGNTRPSRLGLRCPEGHDGCLSASAQPHSRNLAPAPPSVHICSNISSSHGHPSLLRSSIDPARAAEIADPWSPQDGTPLPHLCIKLPFISLFFSCQITPVRFSGPAVLSLEAAGTGQTCLGCPSRWAPCGPASPSCFQCTCEMAQDLAPAPGIHM